MWVLVVLALVGLILFIERTLFLHRGQIPSSKAFLQGIKKALAKRRLVEALTLCEEAPGPVAGRAHASAPTKTWPADRTSYFTVPGGVPSVSPVTASRQSRRPSIRTSEE